MQKIKYIIGIDEAGRGPLAGPVAIGAVCVPHGFNWKMIPGVGDSKKVTPKNRDAVFRRAQTLKKDKVLNFSVVQISAKTIDRIGITKAVSLGIVRCLKKINMNPKHVDVRLDGLLHAPSEYVNQKTIIKGDAKEKVIGLASICAKVTRDKTMVRLAKKYPQYKFAVHKGYGTKIHTQAIKKHGPSHEHRRTFLKNLTLTK